MKAKLRTVVVACKRQRKCDLQYYFTANSMNYVCNVCARIAQSVERLATGWTVLGIESLCGRNFSHPSRPALGPNHPPARWTPGLFAGGKTAGA